jgi:hypothetical protein
MDKVSYNEYKKKGDMAQEKIIYFLEKFKNRKFIAGDRNGTVVNVDVIEEILGGRYLEPNTLGFRHGPKIALFGKNYALPDELFIINSSSQYEFFEVKNRTIKTLVEEYWKLSDYAKIDEVTGVSVYLSIVIWNSLEKGYDIYICPARRIIKDVSPPRNKKDKVPLNLEMFLKINQYSIKP